jgi:hypothetical protein
MKIAMWSIDQLREKDVPQACINGLWVPSRPENYKPRYCSLLERLRYAWQVVRGHAETFIWPEDNRSGGERATNSSSDAIFAELKERRYADAELAGVNTCVDESRLSTLLLKHRSIAADLQRKYCTH